jgi:hypothetical protein
VPKPKVFVSHVSEEAALAATFKTHLSRDFLGMVDIFVSSDLESIAAGQNWLISLEEALRESSMLLVLCSRASLHRPWVNFETGAAWIKPIPIIPVCHSGLQLRELPIPFSVLQGVNAAEEDGLNRIYTRVAAAINCQVPQRDFRALAAEIEAFEATYRPQIESSFQPEIQRQHGARDRIYVALSDSNYKWRSIERLAVLGGIGEDEVLELLIQDPSVEFGKGKKSGKRIARIKPTEGG